MPAQRKSPVRKATTKRPARTVEAAFEPLVLSTKSDEEEERQVAFSLDGIDYTVPVRVSRSESIRMMRRARDIGFEVAMYEGMEDFYGRDGMDALEKADLSEEQWEQLQKIFMRTVYGTDDPGKATR